MATNREVFDSIAATWYGVRHWPLLPHELNALASRWNRGSLLNLGCGTGADFLPFRDTMELFGLDHSRGMLRQAVRHGQRHGTSAALLQADLTHLPVADASFDWAVGIACYHHIEGAAARTQAFCELWRVLRAGGEAFISVWNYDQPRFRNGPRDRQVPWGREENATMRYYHLYTAEELTAVLTGCGFELLRLDLGTRHDCPTARDPRNLCALFRRPKAWVREC